MADLTPETVSTELTKCADRVDLWLGLSCPSHAIPRPEIAALVTWVRTSVPSPEAIAADRALNAPGDERAAWWALVMGAAASIEDAANCLRDPDAKRQAEGAAKHFRDAANALWSASLSQAPAPAVQPSATAVAWHYPNGKPYTLTWAGDDEARLAQAAAQFGLTRTPLVAAVQPSADSLRAAVEAERDALRERVAAMEAEWDAYGKARAAVARATEREECAAQLDALGCDHCAAAIRARTNGDGP